jgi:hypothetical protein
MILPCQDLHKSLVLLAFSVTSWIQHCINLTLRPRALREQGRITLAAQFTNKGGAGLLI